jgi:transcription initiation factor TFIIIB Brf1 subunit/transcription initiation factor TFIIB
MMAPSFYVACKSNGVPRSVNEIAAMFNVRDTVMRKGCSLFQASVHMDDMESSAPSDFVGRFCSRLEMARRPPRPCGKSCAAWRSAP